MRKDKEEEGEEDVFFHFSIFSFSSKKKNKKMTNEPLRDELARLSRERDALELEVEAASSRLRAAGVGMDTPLVDAEVRKED